MRAKAMNNHNARHGLRVLSLLVAAALFLCAPAFVAAQAQATPAPARIVAIGDVHGDYDAFVDILQKAGLLDANLQWSGGQTALVQTGDYLDRGAKDRQVMDLLIALEKQAPRKGGSVVVLLGNHEVMNLNGDLRYVSAATYASFADNNSEKRRQEAWKEYAELMKALAKARGQAPFVPTPEMQKTWMEAHPPGFLEHRAALAPTGKYGQWLREHRAVAMLGGSVFLHGGISPVLKAPSVEGINNRLAEEIESFDYLRKSFTERRLILPFYTLDEMLAAAQSELEFRNAEMAQEAAAAAAQGKKYTPEASEKRHMERLTTLLGYRNWYSAHPDGPLWFRGYATWTEEEGASRIPSLLSAFGADRFVVGHTPQRDGTIHARFDGRVFLIDTGMLSSYYTGGRASALEMQAGRFTAVYPDQRVTLLEGAVKGGVPGRDLQLEEDLPGGGVAQQAAPAANAAAPATGPPRFWYNPEGQPLPFKTDAEVQEFLSTAKAVKVKGTAVGIGGVRKVTLEKDGLRMNAAFRTIREEKGMQRMPSGRVELNFRDDYIFEQAAYELSLLLGLDNVPPTVVRRVYSDVGTVQAWVEGSMMELDRQQKKIAPPDTVSWNQQVQIMRVFDNLIYNTDRNMGNILIDRNWKLWMIDHTRAFRPNEDLIAPNGVVQCERHLYEKLQTLDPAQVTERLKKHLRKFEIEGLLARRLKLIEHIQKLIREKGEDQVLFTLD